MCWACRRSGDRLSWRMGFSHFCLTFKTSRPAWRAWLWRLVRLFKCIFIPAILRLFDVPAEKTHRQTARRPDSDDQRPTFVFARRPLQAVSHQERKIEHAYQNKPDSTDDEHEMQHPFLSRAVPLNHAVRNIVVHILRRTVLRCRTRSVASSAEGVGFGVGLSSLLVRLTM